MGEQELPTFYPLDAAVPERLETDAFILLPLAPEHVALDYAALMESREMLRLWSGSLWPQDDFTLEDNLADMHWHNDEHRQRLAFTYTVLDTTESRCLGCVYIKPLAVVVAHESGNPERLAEVGDYEAAVRFWVTTPQLPSGLDRRLLESLRGWFEQEWPFRRVLYHTRQVHEQQRALFVEMGLQLSYTLTMPERGGKHQFWEA